MTEAVKKILLFTSKPITAIM